MNCELWDPIEIHSGDESDERTPKRAKVGVPADESAGKHLEGTVGSRGAEPAAAGAGKEAKAAFPIPAAPPTAGAPGRGATRNSGREARMEGCLLYTSDAADDTPC
eukprot:2980159-Pyramimonas_sp.AAC.1